MKLHLPKLLRNALLACISAVAGIALTMGSANAISISQGNVQSSFSTSANNTVETATGTWTYDAGTQTLTIAETAVHNTTITFDMLRWAGDYAGSCIIHTNSGGSSTGLYAKTDGGMGGSFTENNTLWAGGAAYDVDKVLLDSVAGTDGTIEVKLTMDKGSGTHSYDANTGMTLYSAGGLKSGSASWTSLTINKDLVSKIYYETTTQGQKVSNADGTWSKVYATIAQDAVPGEKVNATVFTSNSRNQINGGSEGNGVTLSENGGDIIVGGAGHLYLQTWGAGEINLNNNLYIGSSTFSTGVYNTTNHGVIEIGNDGNSATNLYGEVHVIENSSIVSCATAGGAKAVNFHNVVTGKYALIVGGDNYHFKKGVNLASLTLTQGHWQSTHRTTGSMTFEDLVLVDQLTVDSGVTVTFTGTSKLGISQMVVNNGVVNLNGGTLNATDLSLANYDVVGGTFRKTAGADSAASDNGYASTLQCVLISGTVNYDSVKLEGLDSIAYVEGVGLVGTGATTERSVFYVNTGTVVLGTDGYTDTSATTYVVAGGATLDTNESLKDTAGKHVILKEGATLARSGTDVGTGSIMLTKLTLEGDATVDLEKNYGLLASQYNSTTLTLNGNTLDKQGDATMYLVSTTTDAGTIKISEGTLQAGHQGGNTVNAANADIELDGGILNVVGTMKVGSINGQGTISGAGNLELVTGRTSAIGSNTSVGNLCITAGTVNLVGDASIGGDAVFNGSKGGLDVVKATINIGDGSSANTIVTTRVEMGDIYRDNGGTLNVNAGSTLVVTGSDTTGDDAYKTTGFILSEWESESTLNVYGTLIARNATVKHGDWSAHINLKDGGLLAAKGMGSAKQQSAINLTMEKGSTLVLGEGGLDAFQLNSTLKGGVIGISAPVVTIADNLNLAARDGLVLDTALYTYNENGTEITKGTEGGTLSVSGAIGGAGVIIKKGEGTAQLTGGTTDTFGGTFNVQSGTLELGGNIYTGGTIINQGGTLMFNDATVNVNNTALLDKLDGGTYSDFSGQVGQNGFFSGQAYVVKGDFSTDGDFTLLQEGTEVTEYGTEGGLTISITGDDTYYVNHGTVTLTKTEAVGAFHIASEGVLVYQAGDFTDDVITGSGVYDIGSNYETANRTGVTNAASWTGTVRISNAAVGGNKFDFNNYGNVNSSLELVGVSGWLPQGSNMAARLLLGKDTEAGLNGINVTAASNWTHTFSGGVAGEGDFLVSRTGDGNPDYVFRGDMSDWTGAFRVNNESGNQEVIMKVENTGVVTTVNAGVECISGNLTLEVAGSNGKAVFNKAVNATTLKINGHGEFTKDVTLSGDLKLTSDTNNHVVLHGTNNIVNVIDLSNGNSAAGILELKKDAKLTSRTSLWMRPDASIQMEAGASVIWDDTKITGKAGSVAEIKASANAAQWMDTAGLQVKDAMFEVSKNETRTVAALLQNSSIINSGTALVTVTNSGNTLTGVEAKAGNIVVQNATTDSLVSLGTVTAAEGKSVSAEMESAQVSAITLGAGATFSTNGALTVADGSALSLGAGAGISMNGALTLGSGLAITVSDVTKDTTLFSGVTSIATSLDDITAYISSINGLADLSDYTLELDGTNLVLVVDKGKIVNWSASNSIWEDGAQFGTTTEDIDKFANGDAVVFGTLETNEDVTIKGEIHAISMDVAAGADKTYTFTAAADGGTLTVPSLSITSGKAVFGANTIQLDSLAEVAVGQTGELDVSAYGLGAFSKLVTKTTGDGTVKIGSTTEDAGNAGVKVDLTAIEGTTLNLNANYVVSGNMALDGGNTAETVAVKKGLTVGTLRIQNGTTVEVDGNLVANTIHMGQGGTGGDATLGHLVLKDGGSLSVGTFIKCDAQTANANTFTMNGGILKMTSAKTITDIATTITGGTLVADTASWGITGATIGGATVTDGTLNCAVQIQTTGDNTITLTNATLTGTLDNTAGKLVLAGAVTINGSGFNKQETQTDFSNGGTDGFATTDTYYQLVTTAGNLSIADDTTWSMGKYVATGDKAGWVRVDGTEYGNVYYLNTADTSTTLSDIKVHAGTTYTLGSIALNGGNLEYDVTDAALAINVQKSGIIKITDAVPTDTTEVVLSSSQITNAAGKKATLTGNGVYDLGTVTNLGTGAGNYIADKLKVTLSDTDWKGTVRISGTVEDITLENLGRNGSTVELSGVSGKLSNATYSALNFTRNVLLTNGGFTFTNHAEATYTFSGAVTGDGNLSVMSEGTNALGLKLTGDLSAWKGDFVVGQHTTSTNTPEVNVEFTGGGELFAADSESSIAMNRAGTLNVTIGNTTKATTMNGDISKVADATLNLTTEGEVTMAGTLADGIGLTNNGTLELTQAAATLASLAGTGSVTAKSLTLTGAATDSNGITADSLTLQAATNTVGALTLTGALTLGTADAASSLVVTNGLGAATVNVMNLGNILTAGSLTGAALDINVSEELLADVIGTQSKQATLLTLTGDSEVTTALSLNTHAVGTTFDSASGQYNFTLVWDGKNLVVKTALNGLDWADTNGNRWNAATLTGVPASGFGAIATDDTVGVVFDDDGSAAGVVIVNGDVVARNLTIDRWDDTANNLSIYGGTDADGVDDSVTITNDMTVSGNKGVIIGTLLPYIEEDEPYATDSIAVTVGDVLTIHKGAGVGVATDGSMEAGSLVVHGSYSNLGDTDISGDVTVSADAYMYNGAVALGADIVAATPGKDTPTMEIVGNLSNAGTLLNYPEGELSVEGETTNTGSMTVYGGTVTLGAESTDAAVNSLVNSGSIAVSDGKLTVNGSMTNTGADTESAGLEISGGVVDITGILTNSDVVNVRGGELTIGAEGTGSEVTSMVNSGTLAVTGGSVDINGSVTNDGADTPADMSISGEGTSVNITGALTNADSVVVSDGGSLSAGSAANTGSIEVTGGTLVLGDATTAADTTTLDNDGSLTVNGGEVTINGKLDNDGSLTIGGADSASVTVNGNLENSNGTITIGSDSTTGSLEVTGDLTGTGGTDKLVVNAGSDLTVGQDLKAESVDLAFGGTVTVGGTATVGDLTIEETATFTAASAIIGDLQNDGTLSVGTVVDNELTGGNLEIDSLSGSGAVNVGMGGTLSIGAATNFTGELNNQGSIVVTAPEGVTISKQTAEGGNIDASKLTISGMEVDGVYESANGSILSDVKTDSIIIDKLDTELGSEHLTVNSLTSKTDDTVIDIEIGDLAVDELIAKRGAEYDLIALGGAAPDMNLVNNDDVTTDDMQKLLANGLNIDLLPSEVNPGVMTLTADTMVQLGVRELEIGEATWTVGDSTTGAGLIVLNDSGELKNADILDYVRKVEVSGDATIDLTNVDTAADNPVQINGLSDSETGTGNLTVQGTTDDYVAINNTVIEDVEYPEDSAYVADYTGKLILKDVNADLALEDVTVDATTADTTITGSIKGGSLTVYQDSTAQVGDDGLALTDTTLNVVIEKDFIKLDQETLAAREGSIADLGGDVKADGVEVKIGTLDADGKLVESLGYNKYFDLDTLRIESDGVVLADRNTSYYSDALTSAETSENGAAGLTLADAALLNLNPQGDAVTGDLAAVLDQLDRMVAAGDAAGADELGANLAGASTAVLGMAAMGDVDRQLRAIRNRTTTMGVDQTVVNHDMPYFNAWINAEGDQREMKDDGTLGGYKLNSWGGTVGFDVDIAPTFTAGIALTAMYGDLDATGADKATGNMDTYYVSAFARYCDSAWTHTFVATAGMGDISLDRTVNGTTIEGETNSMSFGLMYEVGRVFALDEDATACIQPVFNVAWRHASVDGYTEKGSDAALEVGDQSLNTITFGLGARLQAVVGESMYNRTSIFECRLLAKADVGDRDSAADVALAGAEAEVKSAETGAFGLEAGAGLTIPLGDEGSSIFMDASVELRADYTNVNGTVGYRINF